VVRLAKPGGLVVIDGVNLDLKVSLVREHGLQPVTEHLDRIFQSDPSKSGWPWQRWGNEPVNHRRPDWQERYAVVFRKR
jgi:hypothetical protein